MKMRLRRRRMAILITAIVFLGGVLFLNRERILLAVGDFLVVQGELAPADIIHVIAGEDYRTDYAIRLYQQGYGKQIFFTGGWCTIHNLYHGEHGKQLSLKEGIPLEAIAIDDSEVKSTYAEVERLKEFIDQSDVPIRSVIVVSDPHHMRRARWAYRHVLGNGVRISMAPVPFESSPYKRQWWTDKESKRMVKDEYVKLGYYLARYQFSGGPLKAWLASLDRY
jgi:uncharacterized SAM-binding protein YcdF (DUF218 family)